MRSNNAQYHAHGIKLVRLPLLVAIVPVLSLVALGEDVEDVLSVFAHRLQAVGSRVISIAFPL